MRRNFAAARYSPTSRPPSSESSENTEATVPAGASIATTGTRLICPSRRKNSGLALVVITTMASTRLVNSVRI